MMDDIQKVIDMIDIRISDEKEQLKKMTHNSVGQGWSMGVIEELKNLKECIIDEIINKP